MASREVDAALPLDQRLKHLARTPDDLATAIHGLSDIELARRPDPKNWSPTEIICHLRDIEEICMMRFRMMLAMDAAKVVVGGARSSNPSGLGGHRRAGACPPPPSTNELHVDPDHRRDDSLDLLARLSPAQCQRACLHPTLGRITFTDWTTLMPGHHDNHYDQLTRAIAGRA